MSPLRYNVIYYKAINDNFKDEKEYYDAVKCSKDSFEEQLSVQNYRLAKVATKYGYCYSGNVIITEFDDGF